MMNSIFKLLGVVCFCGMTCCSGAISAAHAAPTAINAKRFTAVKSWTVYPKNSTSSVTLSDANSDTENAVLQFKGSESSSVYQWVPLQANTLYHISFFYQIDGSGNQADNHFILHFLQTAAPRKRIKSYRYALSDNTKTPEWRHFSCAIVTPDEINQTTQLMFSRGDGEGTLLVKDIQVKPEGAITIPAIAETNQPPTPKVLLSETTSAATDFWNAESKGEAAKHGTEVQLAYSDEALYVLFINHEPHIDQIKKSLTERDGRIWHDDSNEIYIATNSGRAFQLITSAGGAKWDGTLTQRADGDPYKANSSWNGDWQSTVQIDADRWLSAWRIPFAALGDTPSKGDSWRINFVRHRHAGSVRESTRWSYADGASNAVERYGYLQFNQDHATLQRFVEAIELHPLQIDRPKSVYQSVLTTQPGNYSVGDWGHDFFLNRYPPNFQSKYTKESWREMFVGKLQERGESGSNGPFLPQLYRQYGWEVLEEAHTKYGMKFPYSLTTSGNDVAALKNGARYYNEQPHGAARARVVEFDPAKRESIIATLDKFLQSNPDKLDLISHFAVVDEPTNSMFGAFSKTQRTDADTILNEVDQEIRATFGDGRFGLYDYLAPRDANSPYERIAFVRWWNAQMNDWAKQVRDELKQRAPQIPIKIANHNTVSGIPFIDVPLLSQYSDDVSADPYPTATLALYGRARALYHTGFATKWMHDLSGDKQMTTVTQGFVYHGGEPAPQDAREWASQALKNGADMVSWYTLGPSSLTIPETWKEIQQINQQVTGMNQLRIPTTSKTAIFHSFISQAGLDDKALHSEYTVYSLLGERLGSWFDIVGDSDGTAPTLDKYKLIYVPSASYLTTQTAQNLLQQARNGATLVFFDPLSLSHSATGESLASIRQELIGGVLGKQRKATQLSVKGGAIAELPDSTPLPLTPIAQGIHSGAVLAYDIEPPRDATVFAFFEDGKPAAYSRKVGKGRILYFGAQPFGNSDMVLRQSPWENLMRALANEIDEPTDLPIWQFYLQKK